MASSLIESDERTLSTTVGTAIATSRAAQEVQAAVVIAKKFPRDEDAAAAKILKACKRRALAEVACYEYTKGGQKIEGPSIRLAEVLAQNWGNVNFGFTELDRRTVAGVGVSTVEAYCWDMETNTRRSVTFEVRHWRDRKGGGGYPLQDEREIYELIANQASRRMRACILAVIPGDIQDSAVEACAKTLAGQSEEPLCDRVRQMLVRFEEQGVTKADIERKLGHKTDAITHQQLARLAKIFNAIRDGVATREEHFPPESTSEPTATTLGDLAAKGAAKPEAKPDDKPAYKSPLPAFLVALEKAKTEEEAMACWGEHVDAFKLATEDDLGKASSALAKKQAALKAGKRGGA